jgi:hypothetical protein
VPKLLLPVKVLLAPAPEPPFFVAVDDPWEESLAPPPVAVIDPKTEFAPTDPGPVRPDPPAPPAPTVTV